MFDVIVVGSGPAGVFSARQLIPHRVLVLDVGYEASAVRLPAENIYDLRRNGTDLFKELVGEEFESLHNLDRPYMSPKLKGPLWRFVTKRPGISPHDDTESFDAVISYARGGLANAWGAGVLRFNDHDLRGFPLKSAELEPFYDELTSHIGINGAEDDLADYLGNTKALLPPLPLSPLSAALIESYQAHRTALHAMGIRIGRTRAAILTRTHRNRPAYQVLGQDFFQPNLPSIYHPGYTLDEMLAEQSVVYQRGYLVERYEEHAEGVRVWARNVHSSFLESFNGRKVILAAGSINTAKIVLRSNGDFDTKLPLLDNPVSFIPLIRLGRIGQPLPVHSFGGGELLVVATDHDGGPTIQGSFYGLTAPLRADLVAEFPLPLRSSLVAGKYLVPGLAMLQLFYPDEPAPDNYLRLRRDASLAISHAPPKRGPVEQRFVRAMVKLGFVSSTIICRYPIAGSSIHYAGSLPMSEYPEGRYQTHKDGRLNHTSNVYVADAANFPRLPSKNHTFTIMANAMRIANGIKDRLANGTSATIPSR